MEFEYTSLIYCLTSLSIIFGIGWYICFRQKIFAWLDFLWSGSFILNIFIYHLYQYIINGSVSIRIIDMLYIIWSTRLSSHLYRRIKNHGEDKRYLELKKNWKIWYGINFLALFQLEAVLSIVLSIPLFLSYKSAINLNVIFAMIVFLIAIVGETIADSQLKEFVKTNNDPEKVCDIGLWKYSRHPNYFFEWLIWISFAIYGLSSDEKWLSLIPVTIMFILLTKVTGIPIAEKSSLKSKNINYQKYQKRTNAFFPWFPKKIVVSLIIILFTQVAEASMSQQERIKQVFSTLRADNIEILDNFYAPDTKFIDPLGEHNGIKSVKVYYKHLYSSVKAIEFKYNDIISSSDSHVLIWTMTLTTDGLNSGKPIILEGNSYIKFNAENLVIYHRDYFDMGEFVYEHVPVLGWTIKQVKNKLRGEK